MTEVSFKCEIKCVDGVQVVTVMDELDTHTAPRLREQLIEVAALAGDVIVDLSNCDYMDSTGLGVLIGSFKRLRAEDRNMTIVAGNAHVAKVFEITGLNGVFNLFDTLEGALEAS